MNAKAIIAKAERSRTFSVSADHAAWRESIPAAVELAEKLGVKLVVVTVGRDDVLGFAGAFAVKDALKAAGFFWSAAYKTWFAPSDAAFSAVSA